MKATILSLFIFTTSFLFAQNDGKLSIESQFVLFNSTNVAENNLKVRYHFTENHVLRTNWRFQHSSVTDEILEVDGDGVGSIEQVTSGNYISLGYERHFALDKLSPYLGGSLGYGFGNESIYGSRTDGTTFVNDFNYNQKQKLSSVYVDLFSGFDFNIYKGLYLGTEVGFRFLNSKHHRGELQTEDASSTTDSSTTTPIPEKKSTSVSLINMGVVRVGWKF